ncbi:MAG: OmpA family protein [Rhodothermales bacterium]
MSDVSSKKQDGDGAVERVVPEAEEEPGGLSNALMDAELEELRRLLLAPEQDHLAQVLERLRALERRMPEVDEVGRVLPEAVALRAGQDKQLARALEPTIEETLRGSIQRDPQPFADALFPIFGPAIRKSIREALRALLDAVNRTLEHSLSVQSFRWRVEAWRTGQPFSQIMLRHTLLYRVEQVFLIDHESGLPIRHVVAEAVEAQDSALVSGMLTAIQDFAEDSLGAGQEDSLATMQVGELTVWIEAGPEAMLAAVVRGIPAPELRTVMKDVIETIHLQFKAELEAFEGDPEPLADTHPLLEAALLAQYEKKERKTSPMLWGLLAVLLLLLCIWIIFSLRDHRRWNAYLALLEAEPGIVVAESGRSGGAWFVKGLRDPLAKDPDALLAQTPIPPGDVRGEWTFFQALDSAMVVQRATQWLEPPPTVALYFESGVLAVSGSASAAWIEEARTRARFLPGVAVYDDAALRNEEKQRLQELSTAFERQTLRFTGGTTTPAPGQEAALDALIAEVEHLQAAAGAAGERILLQIRGHVSTEGDPATNQFLSLQRAEAVRQVLVRAGLTVEVEVIGTGVPRYEGEERTEEDRAANRSVSFRVVRQDG